MSFSKENSFFYSFVDKAKKNGNLIVTVFFS